jgi:hypothetical protein
VGMSVTLSDRRLGSVKPEPPPLSSRYRFNLE